MLMFQVHVVHGEEENLVEGKTCRKTYENPRYLMDSNANNHPFIVDFPSSKPPWLVWDFPAAFDFPPFRVNPLNSHYHHYETI